MQPYHVSLRLDTIFTCCTEMSSFFSFQRDSFKRLHFSDSIFIVFRAHSSIAIDGNGTNHHSTNLLPTQISIEYKGQHQHEEQSKRRKCRGNRKLQRVRRRYRAKVLKDRVTSPLIHNLNTEIMDTTNSGPSREV